MQPNSLLQTLLPLLLLWTLALVAQASPRISRASRRQLLLVSLDGFRHDYLTIYANQSRFLRQMASEGVFVRSMQTEFVTKTFPNHWVIATGLHQESNGIVSNGMYDPVFNATFGMSTREERWWNDSLPIWVTAKRQGLKTATFFWPGSEVEFGGTRPDHYFPYDGRISYEYRIDTITSWLADEQIDLCTLYFNEPDSAGHSSGPESVRVSDAIIRLNHLLELLVYRLERRGVRDRVDIIVTSDHGMTELNDSKAIHFNNELDPFVDRYMDSGPLLSMFAKPGQRDRLVEFLQNQTKARSLPVRVFTRESMPPAYRYSQHRRIPDVLVLPDPGYVVFRRSTNLIKGNHGFDNTYGEMKVPLIAVGPSFRRGVEVEGFRQVDIYGLMCHLLGIRPQPNNGSSEHFSAMLSSDSSSSSTASTSMPMTTTSAAGRSATAAQECVTLPSLLVLALSLVWA
uniref:Ectonucleotide pyrophosphatase/phosphodiesterase family member 5 n=2 Tax=Macrostomum lignano TaxID=282301 RepID=A0A1I8HTZ1_9PLAT